MSKSHQTGGHRRRRPALSPPADRRSTGENGAFVWGTRFAVSGAVQPHDRLFRAIFSEPEHALGLLRSALPAEVSRRVDWTTLRALGSGFIDPELLEHRSDLLFSVKLDGRVAFLHLLLEHQSTTDPMMPLRLLSYMARIWEDFRKNHPGATRVPAIVPIVCHHSRRGWRGPVALREVIDLPAQGFEGLERHLPSFELILDDLSAEGDEQLRKRVLSVLARAALVCLTRVRGAPDVVAVLERFREVFAAVTVAPSGVAALSQMISYILHATEALPEQLRPFFTQLGTGAEEAFMTGADMLRAEGEAKGKAEGKAELLLKQLALKFGELSPAARERLQRAKLGELDTWAERVLSAATLEEVFGTE